MRYALRTIGVVAGAMLLQAEMLAAQVLVPGQSSTSTTGPTTAPTTGNRAAPRSAAKTSLPLTIGTTSLRVPVMDGHCAADVTQAYDREFINGFTRQTQNVLQYLGTTFECNALAIARAGTLPTSEFVNYMTLNGGTPTDLQQNSRHAAAEQVCARQQLPGQVLPLQARGQALRVVEFSALPNGPHSLGNAVIGATSGVCYTGRFLKSADGPFQETIWAQGWTRVRGHVVAVVLTSGAPTGRATPYDQLHAKLSAHMAEFIATNPD